MTRTQFVAWLLALIQAAPEPTRAEDWPENEEYEAVILVEIHGKTFAIAVSEIDDESFDIVEALVATGRG